MKISVPICGRKFNITEAWSGVVFDKTAAVAGFKELGIMKVY